MQGWAGGADVAQSSGLGILEQESGCGGLGRAAWEQTERVGTANLKWGPPISGCDRET